MTNRLKFRRLILNDASRLYDIYSDKAAMKFRGSAPMETIDDALSFIKNKHLTTTEHVTIRKGIELIKNKQLIGSVMLRYWENKTSSCEIGYSIGSHHWGFGFGKETIAMLLNDLKQNSKLTEVLAWSNKKNVASIKILEHNGFKKQVDDVNDNYLYIKDITS